MKKREVIISNRTYFLGADIAGLGSDETTIEILDGEDRENIEQVESEILRKKLTTEISQRIINLNKIWHFGGIGVDDGGVGFGVFSELMNDESTKRKTTALNNASRVAGRDEQQKKLLKEEMYQYLLTMGEQKKIKLLLDDDVIQSLKSIQYEYLIKEGRKTTLRIFGNYSHITEGIIRALWLIKTKGLKLFVHTF